jgi:hypothetical protein
MIQQELVQNPVLEEGTEIVESTIPEIDIDRERPENPRDVGWNRRRIPVANGSRRP